MEERQENQEEVQEELDQPQQEEQVEKPQQVEEETQEEPEPEPEPEEQQEQPEEPREPSRREQLRIQQVLAKLKTQPPQQQPQQPRGMDYRETLNADPETIAQLEQDRHQYGESYAQRAFNQAQSIQFHTRLEIDAPKIEGKYSYMNPSDKANFKPLVADAVNNFYLGMTGYDPETDTASKPNIRYAEFVDSLHELAEHIAGQKLSQTRTNLTRQVRQTGLRPDGSAAKALDLNKAPSQMTDEELNAVIGQAI